MSTDTPEAPNATLALVDPFRLGPPKLIMGLEVTTFSYVFLGIGGIAPIVFIVSVIIVMKCYAWRKLHSYKKYKKREQISQDVWELERRHYFGRNGTGGAGPGLDEVVGDR